MLFVSACGCRSDMSGSGDDDDGNGRYRYIKTHLGDHFMRMRAINLVCAFYSYV